MTMRTGAPPLAATGDDDVHVAGTLLRLRPAQQDAALQALAALPGVETHVLAAGKLAVISERPDMAQTLALLDALRALPGVLDAALVYQHAEPCAALAQPMTVAATAQEP